VKSLDFTVKSLHFTVKSLRFTVKSLDFTVKSLDCTVKAPDFTVKSPDFTVKSPDFTVKSPDFTVRSTDFTVKAPDCTVKSLDFTAKPPLHTEISGSTALPRTPPRGSTPHPGTARDNPPRSLRRTVPSPARLSPFLSYDAKVIPPHCVVFLAPGLPWNYPDGDPLRGDFRETTLERAIYS
jgi:hypothetical protein